MQESAADANSQALHCRNKACRFAGDLSGSLRINDL